MPKILSQSGITLADTYDVEGSIAGIEQLNSEDVSLVHEMGSTIFSERFSATIRRNVTGNINQSTAFEALISDFPADPTRILGIGVLSDTIARTSIASVMVQSDVASRELPIWVWDGTNEDSVRFFDVTVGNKTLLRPIPAFTLLPNMITGTFQPQRVENVILRGTTSAFGAGTLELTLLVYIAFASVGGISSQGLPIPSW